VALALLAAAPAAGAKTAPPLAGAVRVSFTGSGQETYRDYKEWIYQSTNSCWYDKTVDNTATYSWSTAWKPVPLATVARRIEAAVPSSATAQGSVTGSDLHGDCGALEPLAGWAGTRPCADTLQALDSGTLDVSAGRKGTVVVDVQAPRFSLPQPPTCSVNPRNSQLTVSIGLSLARLAGLARGKSLTIAVGTSMRGSLVPYAPDYNCDTSEAPYEGVFIFDHCKDTLVWGGTLTITKL
jgi:hypothetical protein